LIQRRYAKWLIFQGFDRIFIFQQEKVAVFLAFCKNVTSKNDQGERIKSV